MSVKLAGVAPAGTECVTFALHRFDGTAVAFGGVYVDAALTQLSPQRWSVCQPASEPVGDDGAMHLVGVEGHVGQIDGEGAFMCWAADLAAGQYVAATANAGLEADRVITLDGDGNVVGVLIDPGTRTSTVAPSFRWAS